MSKKHMMLWDIECEKCNNIFEEWCDPTLAPNCPICGSAFTKVLPGASRPIHKAKDPYDYLDKGIPDGKRIFSGPKVRSK
jgi:hypothetical protein